MTTAKADATTVPLDQRTFQIFNKTKTVGVRSTHGGTINGFYFADSVRNMSERALIAEVMAVAKIAYLRGRLSLREVMDASAAAADTFVSAGTYEMLPDLPTAAEYEQIKRETLKY